jgi:hypothetical protein
LKAQRHPAFSKLAVAVRAVELQQATQTTDAQAARAGLVEGAAKDNE